MGFDSHQGDVSPEGEDRVEPDKLSEPGKVNCRKVADNIAAQSKSTIRTNNGCIRLLPFSPLGAFDFSRKLSQPKSPVADLAVYLMVVPAVLNGMLTFASDPMLRTYLLATQIKHRSDLD